MSEDKKSLTDLVYIILSVISFGVSLYPNISEDYKIALLIGTILLLALIYFSNHFKINEETKKRLNELEKKIENMEDLINIKTDINVLKEMVKKK